jgi:dihydrofolate reductase
VPPSVASRNIVDMGKVFFDIGVSLDGFIAGDNRGPKNPLGDNGMNIHQWMYRQKAFWRHLNMDNGEEDGGADGQIIQDTIDRTGAYIMGKRMFEEGEANWPENLFKKPVYVLTHGKREPWIQKGTTAFYFINDGIESALEKAHAASNGKDVRLQGGGDMLQQYLTAGYVDEFIIHIAPLFIGSGIRLFDHIDHKKLQVKLDETIKGHDVLHLKYSVVRK